jgi:hypothetical protein
MKAAHLLGTYKGRKVYRFPVTVRVFMGGFEWAEVEDKVDAYTAAEAANHVRDEWQTVPQVEVVAYGPKGGKTHRWIGWESAIGARMFTMVREERQGAL